MIRKLKSKISAIVILLTLVSSSAVAGGQCFQDPGMSQKPAYNGSPMSNQGQQALTNQLHEDNANPVLELWICALQAVIEGPGAIVEGICGCKEAIEASCEYLFMGIPPVPVAIPKLPGVMPGTCEAFFIIYLGTM